MPSLSFLSFSTLDEDKCYVLGAIIYYPHLLYTPSPPLTESLMLTMRAILSSQNFNRPAKEICLDLLRAMNGVRWRPHMVVFGLPQELDQRPDIDWDSNTYLQVRTNPAEDIRFMNGGGLMYRRMWLHEINNSCCLQLVAPHFPFTTEDILGDINRQLKTQLTLDDLEDIEIPRLGEYRFPAAKYSLNWIGDLTIRVASAYTHLITETDLLGFFVYDVTQGLPATPYKGISEDRLTDIINETNELELIHGNELTYGEITVLDSHPTYNTSVRVHPTALINPEQTVRYNRLSLSVLEQLEPLPKVTIPHLPFSIHQILPEINEALGLDLKTSEVLNTTYDAISGRYRLEIATPTASLAWVKSHYDFEVDFGFDLGRIRITAEGEPRLASQTDVRIV